MTEEEIEGNVANMTELQRLYCEYRARNLTMKEAARKAGSNGNEDSLKKVGFQIEQMVGSKEYITYLREQAIKAALLDSVEILDKLRKTWNRAFHENKLKEANDAVRLMGQMIGLFSAGKMEVKEEKVEGGKNNTAAFKEESGMEENETEDRIRKLQSMLKDINK